MVTYGVCLLKGFKRGLGGSKEKWFRGAICFDSKVLMALRLVKSQAKIPRPRNKLFNQKKAWLKVSFLEDFPVINGTCTCLNRSQMTISKVYFQKMVSIKAKKVSMGTKWRSWVFCVEQCQADKKVMVIRRHEITRCCCFSQTHLKTHTTHASTHPMIFCWPNLATLKTLLVIYALILITM